MLYREKADEIRKKDTFKKYPKKALTVKTFDGVIIGSGLIPSRYQMGSSRYIGWKSINVFHVFTNSYGKY
jgi:hypothetical protein